MKKVRCIYRIYSVNPTTTTTTNPLQGNKILQVLPTGNSMSLGLPQAAARCKISKLLYSYLTDRKFMFELDG